MQPMTMSTMETGVRQLNSPPVRCFRSLAAELRCLGAQAFDLGRLRGIFGAEALELSSLILAELRGCVALRDRSGFWDRAGLRDRAARDRAGLWDRAGLPGLTAAVRQGSPPPSPKYRSGPGAATGMSPVCLMLRLFTVSDRTYGCLTRHG